MKRKKCDDCGTSHNSRDNERSRKCRARAIYDADIKRIQSGWMQARDAKPKPQAVKPSTLPWELLNGADGYTIMDANGEPVGPNYPDKKHPSLIVRAVNAYAGFVEASREVLANWESGDLAEAVRHLSNVLVDAGEHPSTSKE